MRRLRALAVITLLSLVAAPGATQAQTNQPKEHFTATALVNNNLGAGAGTVLIDISRWSTTAERDRLLNVLDRKGASKLLDELQDTTPVGRIRTPDSLGYDLHYASQTPTESGGRRIVLATDRPIGFWEAYRGSRTLDYPFTVIQIEMPAEGTGKGTLSYATKVIKQGNNIVLENFATQPVMLTEVRAEAEE
jgi:hypothetical protein